LLGQCESSEKTFMIKVHPKPYLTSTAHNGVICTGSAFNYEIATSLPVTEISWTRVAHPDINNGAVHSGTGAYISEKLYNTGNSEVTVTYMVSVKLGTCEYKDMSLVTVKVIPVIELNIESLLTVCNNEPSLSVTYNINADNAQYRIQFGSEAIVAGFVNVPYTELPDSAFNILIPQNVTPGHYTLKLSVRLGECENEHDLVIVVNTIPEATEMSDADLYFCENDELYLFVKTQQNVTYQWYFNDELIAGATASYYVTDFDESKAGVYAVEITNECGKANYKFNVVKNQAFIERKWEDVLYVSDSEGKYVAYQWYKNGEPIATAGNSKYYTEHGCFTSGAEYNVRAYKADGTYDEACPIIPNEGSCISEIMIYPNPAISGTKITIQLDEEFPEATASVYDMTGRVVETFPIKNRKTEHTVNYAVGTYIINIQKKDDKQYLEKLIIQK